VCAPNLAFSAQVVKTDFVFRKSEVFITSSQHRLNAYSQKFITSQLFKEK
jgi:hypothetical protein